MSTPSAGIVGGRGPSERVVARNAAPVRAEGRCVLYWMVASRRTRWSFALDHALGRAAELGKPLVVLEALRAGYPYASERLHRFVMEGMADNAARLDAAGVARHSYVEPEPGAGRGLLEALAADAALVVTDELPAFFLPRMVEAAAARLDVRLESVDGNGLLPLRAGGGRAFATAALFRRHVHKWLLGGPPPLPAAEPLDAVPLAGAGRVPEAVTRRWPGAELDDRSIDALLERLPIERDPPASPLRGGSVAGEERADSFLSRKLSSYAEDRAHPDRGGTSGLSPYLHFGHVSSVEVVSRLLEDEGWSPDRLAPEAVGRREGFWGVSESAEAFLDQILTWRELGFAHAFARPEDSYTYDALPAWARATLEAHAGDRRSELYDLEELAAARTADPIWNAAQRQLLEEGVVHNYLRMLWGKKILEWSPGPRVAFERMVALNDRYALDGRDPGSASGILWTLGLFDRPWGPERPIFGKVRYMTSASARRKLELEDYLSRYSR